MVLWPYPERAIQTNRSVSLQNKSFELVIFLLKEDK